MIKLLIADDEPLVLAGMKSMLPWNRLGLEICGTAQNGQQALELIRQYRPEIVITDIKMPVMTGLELAQHCRAEFGDLPLFIMLTSFEEFSYVREAMHHGAIEYIVKLELTPQSLEMTVRKAMEMVAKIQNKASSGAPAASLQLFRDKFFTRLCNNMFENREQFCRQHEDLGLQFDAERYLAASCSITNVKDISAQQQLTLCSSTVSMVQDILKKLCTCQVTILDTRHFNIVFWMTAEQAYDLEFQNHLLQTASDTASRYFSVRLLCGIGTPVEDPFLIAQSVYSARCVLAAATEAQPVLNAQQDLADQNALFDFSAYRLRLTKAFEELDGTVLEQTISDIIDSLEGHPSRHIQALDAATNLLYMSLSLLPEGETLLSNIFADHPDGYRSLYKYVSTHQCCEWMRQLRDGLCQNLKSQRKSYKKQVVENVEAYIRQNIRKRLTLNEVAAAFNFSPNYLSQLFAKYAARGFVDTITSEKIAAAKVMLAEHDMKIYEVAEALGYESAFYFSRVFKKETGISPREYIQNTSK